MDPQLDNRRADLIRLTRSDADPKVRHRAHVLLAAQGAASHAAAARATGTSVRSLQRWRARYLAEALEAEPSAFGYPVATWTIADLTDLLARRGWAVAPGTVNRAVHALGYVHRRPRHDLRHRQDAEAVASAQRVLAELQKRGLMPPAACGSSISTSASFTLIPTWRKAGGGAANPAASPPPEPTDA